MRIPKVGYVGVGLVESHAQSAKDFEIETLEGSRPCLEVLTKGSYHRDLAHDPDKAEYFVQINWLKTVPLDQAFHEVGLLGQQNSICKPTAPKVAAHGRTPQKQVHEVELKVGHPLPKAESAYFPFQARHFLQQASDMPAVPSWSPGLLLLARTTSCR